MWDDYERKGEGETRCWLIAFSSQKAPRGSARLNVPVRWTNCYQQYNMPYQHMYCGRVWNLIQACDVQSSDWKVYICTPPSPEVENFQMKIYYPARDRTPRPAEPEQGGYCLAGLKFQYYFRHISNAYHIAIKMHQYSNVSVRCD